MRRNWWRHAQPSPEPNTKPAASEGENSADTTEKPSHDNENRSGLHLPQPVPENKLLHPEQTANERQRKWEKYTQIPLILASLAFLVAYTWRVAGALHGEAYVVANWTMTIARAMFVTDYLVRLSLAKNRWHWFRTNLISLAWTIMPVLRLVLLLRIFTRLQGRRATPGNRMRIRIVVYGAGSSVILIYLSALAVLDAERVSSHANIKSFQDAIWWACVTVTTTGYGDFTPVTAPGRWIGAMLMFGGMGLLGVTTGILASLMTEIATNQTNAAALPATKGQISALSAQVEKLQRQNAELLAQTHKSPEQQTKPAPEHATKEPKSADAAEVGETGERTAGGDVAEPVPANSPT